MGQLQWQWPCTWWLYWKVEFGWSSLQSWSWQWWWSRYSIWCFSWTWWCCLPLVKFHIEVLSLTVCTVILQIDLPMRLRVTYNQMLLMWLQTQILQFHLLSFPSSIAQTLEKDQINESKLELKKKLSYYAMRTNYELRVKKSKMGQFDVGCIDSNCMWKLHVMLMSRTKFWPIRVYSHLTHRILTLCTMIINWLVVRWLEKCSD